jgi:hypothetical protein
MKGRTLLLVKRTHLFLSVFFSPILMLFLLTGLWQTMASDEEKENQDGIIHAFVLKLSTIHTDSYFPHAGANHGSHLGFKILVASMCAAFGISILLGWALAWQTMKQKWLLATVLGLGILIPVLLLWFF